MHRTGGVRRPQSHCMVEERHRSLIDAHVRGDAAGKMIKEIRAVLDTWLQQRNCGCSHLGYRNQGLRPCKTAQRSLVLQDRMNICGSGKQIRSCDPQKSMVRSGISSALGGLTMRKILLVATIAGFAAVSIPAQTQAQSIFGSFGSGSSSNLLSNGSFFSQLFGGGGSGGGGSGGGGSSIGGGPFANIAAGLVNNARRSTLFTICATLPIIGRSCDDGSVSPSGGFRFRF